MTDDEWEAVAGAGGRPAIRLDAPDVLDQVQRALIGAGHNIFVRGSRRGPRLVRFDHGGFYRRGDSPVPVASPWLRHHMAQAADFLPQGAARRDRLYPPAGLARSLLRKGEWLFRPLPEDHGEWPALIAKHRRERTA